MVQLKDSFSSSIVDKISDFNSSMVQLKDFLRLLKYLRISDFNSSMVQLKELKRNLIQQNFYLFQFLYGTIKSCFRKVLV